MFLPRDVGDAIYNNGLDIFMWTLGRYTNPYWGRPTGVPWLDWLRQYNPFGMGDWIQPYRRQPMPWYVNLGGGFNELTSHSGHIWDERPVNFVARNRGDMWKREINGDFYNLFTGGRGLLGSLFGV